MASTSTNLSVNSVNNEINGDVNTTWQQFNITWKQVPPKEVEINKKILLYLWI